MQGRWFGQRPLLSLPQILTLVGVVAALFIGLDLNRRSQAGELVGLDEEILNAEIDVESTRQVELQATLEYVQGDDYVAAYARNEGGFLLPGEKRVVPLFLEATPMPTATPPPEEDPIEDARPWQAWWRLISDAPLPQK